MGEIINLNQYRKALQRAHKTHKSAENRVKFGRLKFEKETARREITERSHQLDMSKIENFPLSLSGKPAPDDPSAPPHETRPPGKST